MAKLLHIFYHKEGTFSLLCQQVQYFTLSTKPVTNITCKQQVLTNIWQQKSQKTKGLHHNFPVTHKSYSPSIEFIIIGQSRL